MSKCSSKFRQLVLEADDWRCANPFCKHPIQAADPFSQLLNAHSLMPPRHVLISEAITLCAYCHEKVESGYWKEVPADDVINCHCVKPRHRLSKTGRVYFGVRQTGRELEIEILEWYRDNRPDKFRWGLVLKFMYKKRKVVF